MASNFEFSKLNLRGGRQQHATQQQFEERARCTCDDQAANGRTQLLSQKLLPL
jgi:hypothetical protein